MGFTMPVAVLASHQSVDNWFTVCNRREDSVCGTGASNTLNLVMRGYNSFLLIASIFSESEVRIKSLVQSKESGRAIGVLGREMMEVNCHLRTWDWALTGKSHSFARWHWKVLNSCSSVVYWSLKYIKR